MRLNDLQPASFKGARFFAPSDQAEIGRNTIDNLYPDGGFRYAEDNGKIPGCFRISAVLHGDDLPGQINRLMRACSSPGPGVLKHPWLGTKFCQIDGKISVKRDDKNAGVMEIEIPLLETGAPVLPGILSGIAALVSSLSNSSVAALFTAFRASFGTPTSARSASVIATSISGVFSEIENRFGGSGTAASRIVDRAETIARDVSQGSGLFTAAFRDPIDDDEVSSAKLIKGFREVFDAASAVVDDSILIVGTTADLVTRKRQVESIGIFCEAAAFAGICEGMASRAYTTAEEVFRDENILVGLFETIQSRGLPAEQHAQLSDLYVATSDVLRDVAVRLPRIVEIDVKNYPASVLSYLLYDSDERTQRLVDLNLNQDPCLLAGTTTILD